ncbi:MAG TPA: C4-type zinc ribbon domain-containing protein [Chloroflexota bacterium]|nr:C4-type zinc ribbon domain-containing protein [Chloroflexota bacterium]
MRKIDLLRQLQDLDSRLEATRTAIAQLGHQIGDRSALAGREAERARLRDAVRDAEAQQRDLELQAEDRRVKIASDEAKLYGGRVTNPKELQSLSDEVAQDRRQLSAVEDQLLLLLERIDELTTKLAEEDSAYERELAAWNASQQSARDALDTAQSNLGALEQQRTSAASQVAPADLTTYETIRRQKGGTAVAQVQQRTCQACRVALTPSQEQRARIGNDLVLCNSCGRILFVPLS